MGTGLLRVYLNKFTKKYYKFIKNNNLMEDNNNKNSKNKIYSMNKGVRLLGVIYWDKLWNESAMNLIANQALLQWHQ